MECDLWEGSLRNGYGHLEIAGKKSDIIMSSLLFSQVLNLKMTQWPASIGGFASQLREFESIRNFFTASTIATLVDLPFAVIFLLVIYYIGGPMVAVPLIVIGLLLLYSFILIKPLKDSIESTFEATASKNAHQPTQSEQNKQASEVPRQHTIWRSIICLPQVEES